MAKEYAPRGHVKAILDGMAAQDKDMEWAGAELADLAGIKAKAVPTTVKTAIRNGVLFSQKRGQKTFYSLTAYELEAAEVVAFNAALYLDGDLVIYGAQVNEDDSVTLNAKQLATLKKLIAWSPAA